MQTTFDTVAVGQEFKWGIYTLTKIDDSYYPKNIPLHKRKPNCINNENNHKCVLGRKVIVEVDRIR